MTGKRQATSDLNHLNWDQEEEQEDAGHFREAKEDELKSRVIKKAHRRIVNGSTVGTTSNSIFSGFKGFDKGATTPNSDNSGGKFSPFAFLAKIPTAGTSVSTTGTSTSKTASSTLAPTFSFGVGSNAGVSKTDKSIAASSTESESVYASKIVKLNQTFCSWIKKHVEEQPLCNLMPTFKDYEKYINEIQKEQEKTGKSDEKLPTPNIVKSFTSPTTAPSMSFSSGTAASNIKTSSSTSISVEEPKEKKENNLKANGSDFSFGLKNTVKPNGNSLPSSGFMFGQTKSNGSPGTTNTETSTAPKPFSFSSPLSTKPTTEVTASSIFGSSASHSESKPPAVTPFSFGLKNDDAPKSTTSGFSFASSSTPFSFGNIKPPAAAPAKEGDGNEDDEDELPKEEIKEVVEDDALYTKKCKVFVKKDGTYKDCGVGTFYLKPVKDSSKTQLLVRSCNNLGTILVNVILVEGMPTQRMGKNNVMLVHPAAAGESKPQTTLFRVKDGPEADELLETINNHKK